MALTLEPTTMSAVTPCAAREDESRFQLASTIRYLKHPSQ